MTEIENDEQIVQLESKITWKRETAGSIGDDWNWIWGTDGSIGKSDKWNRGIVSSIGDDWNWKWGIDCSIGKSDKWKEETAQLESQLTEIEEQLAWLERQRKEGIEDDLKDLHCVSNY